MSQYPQGIFQRLDWLTKKYKQLCCNITPSAYRVYTALLTQQIISPEIIPSPLTVGRTYLIEQLADGDDFSNVGYTGNYIPFIATGTTPLVWTTTQIIDMDASQPSVTILQDNISPNVYFAYLSYEVEGKYSPYIVFEKTGEFLVDKTFIPIGNNSGTKDIFPIFPIRRNDNRITIQVDGKQSLVNASIEIRVYN